METHDKNTDYRELFCQALTNLEDALIWIESMNLITKPGIKSAIATRDHRLSLVLHDLHRRMAVAQRPLVEPVRRLGVGLGFPFF